MGIDRIFGAGKMAMLCLALGLTLTGCGGAFFIVGDVVNAAGHAMTSNDPRDYRPSEDAVIEDYLREGAELGDPESQYQLGIYYMRKKNSQAFDWVCSAADQQHPRAQLLMGHWYSQDRSRSDIWPYIQNTLDDRNAYVWYSLAQGNGDNDAALFRDNMARNRMNEKQLQEARRLLDDWRPGTCRT